MAQQVNESQFEAEVIKNSGVTVVDFWAEWCGPCKMIGPIFEEVSKELTDVKFVKVNVDECPNISSKLKIVSIPTIMIFKNGSPADILVGFMPKQQLKAAIEKHI